MLVLGATQSAAGQTVRGGPAQQGPGPAWTVRASVGATGLGADGRSFSPAVSASGRFVSFASLATNLVSGDTNATYDVFVRDLRAGTTERVSVDSGEAEGNGASGDGSALSADGRYVAFYSFASNLTTPDTNGVHDVFVRDRVDGTTECVSLDSFGVPGNGSSVACSLSADGRFVAFLSAASNLVALDTNGVQDVFVRDRLSGTTARVSVDSSGVQGNGHAVQVRISADGRHVAFTSLASNHVPSDTNGVPDVFVHDRVTGVTERVSVSSTGAQASGEAAEGAPSADGRYVAFYSSAANLVALDTNGVGDIFVRDRLTGTTARVSIDSSGGQAGAFSSWPTISNDGRCVAFESLADDLVSGDTNGTWDVFVHDRASGATTRASLGRFGDEAAGPCRNPVISAAGHLVAFSSTAGLVPMDSNALEDVFVRRR